MPSINRLYNRSLITNQRKIYCCKWYPSLLGIHKRYKTDECDNSTFERRGWWRIYHPVWILQDVWLDTVECNYMEECNVILMNLGLHYNAGGAMKCDKWVFSELKDDIRAAITFLVEFAASKSNRIAVWRSALPQHFNTTDGHYQKGKTCSLAQLLLQNHPTETRKGNGVTRQAIQNYNQAYDEVFGDSCEPVPGSCNGLTYQHSCTMNLTSTNYRTVY